MSVVGVSEKVVVGRQRSMSVKSHTSDIQNLASEREAEAKKVYCEICD